INEVAQQISDGHAHVRPFDQLAKSRFALAQPSFTKDLFGCLAANDQCPANSPVSVANGAVAIGPIHILQLAVAINRHELISMPRRLASIHYPLNLRSNDRPNLRPTFRAPLTKSLWMFVFANTGAVSIVVELDQLRPPPKKHRMTRGKQHVDRGNEG